jgi:hypothetical protein
MRIGAWHLEWTPVELLHGRLRIGDFFGGHVGPAVGRQAQFFAQRDFLAWMTPLKTLGISISALIFLEGRVSRADCISGAPAQT